MIYINVLHQIDPIIKLIVIKSFVCAYPYSKDKYKSFNSHLKYHSYYFSLKCNNSIKITSSPDGGLIPLGTIVMLLSLLSRLNTSITIAGCKSLGSWTNFRLVSISILNILCCFVGILGLSNGTTTIPVIIITLSLSVLNWSNYVAMVYMLAFDVLLLVETWRQQDVIISPKNEIYWSYTRHAS